MVMANEVARSGLDHLVSGLREQVLKPADPADTAQRVRTVLEERLPGPGILSAQELVGDPEGYQQHVLHIEPDGAFSVVALVWRPQQQTPIHDHVSWCVVGVVQGTESEEIFELREHDGAPVLVRSTSVRNPAGSVCAFSPPGDIHCVRNCGDSIAVSLHVYGADIGRLGSSIRRRYDYPIAG
jgi:predicted metal-dependent enzyme (double-stranded beta helix superfamily)